MAVDKLAESSEIDLLTSELGLVGVDVTVAQNLVGVAERLEDGALARAVAAEKQGYRPEVDADGGTDALEVLDFDGGDQWRLRPGCCDLDVGGRLRRRRPPPQLRRRCLDRLGRRVLPVRPAWSCPSSSSPQHATTVSPRPAARHVTAPRNCPPIYAAGCADGILAGCRHDRSVPTVSIV